MKISDNFGFYAIISDPVRGYEYIAEMLVQHEIKFIQLRMKKEIQKDILKTAERLQKITSGSKSFFIINDHAEIAKAADADGVHLGQDDMPLKQVVEILGHDKIVGLSTHNTDQTRAACQQNPAYVGVGPVYKTPTKDIPDPVIGISGMKEMLSIATVPAVAIGAINKDNLRDVLRAGARNFCSVRPINQSEDPENALKELLAIYNQETGQ